MLVELTYLKAQMVELHGLKYHTGTVDGATKKFMQINTD
jgi:hypothetical protein